MNHPLLSRLCHSDSIVSETCSGIFQRALSDNYRTTLVAFVMSATNHSNQLCVETAISNYSSCYKKH
jgi:hypothetical protein